MVSSVFHSVVLILIILEILYEAFGYRLDAAKADGLNPYYTGNTL